MERSSSNFQSSSSYRKSWAIFASPNSYFRENSRWVPLSKYKFAFPKPHVDIYIRSLSRSGNVLWNRLTLEVRQLTSLYVFKGKLKALIQRYVIFSHGLFVKHAFLLLLLQYLNKIPCINNVTYPLSHIIINGFRQLQTSSSYQQCVLKQCIQL